MSTTITMEVYEINELSGEALENAYNDFCRNDFCYPWAEENENTLKSFERIFPVNIKGWQYGYCNDIEYNFTEDDDIGELKGIRLMKHIYNNYEDDLFRGKYYSTKGNYINGKYEYKSRNSKIIKNNDCVLTGYYMDDEILKPIYDFLKNPSENITFYDLMDGCLNTWIEACNRDYENYFSMDNFIELCECNEYKFDEEGYII